IWKYAAAGIIALVLTAILTAHQYTTTIISKRGEYQSFILPDQSHVNLNAESKLSYKPYWWFFSRDVRLQGEACFKVKSGSRFRVTSGKNSANVVGTIFNVFARREIYRVTCLAGTIEVSANNETVTLKPDMQVTYRKKERILDENINSVQSTAWVQDKFAFLGTPLVEVIAEIERRYDIHISAVENPDFTFTGNFPKTDRPEDVLEIIGKPFGIAFKIEK
ncbi:MAG: FecR domain-containing protein, partial [Candidatus Symbiothrix sp.]|nr:FecR domain-containing protein [Candidatus Symbiothrix sp.]